MSNTKKLHSKRLDRRLYFKKIRSNVRQVLGGGHSKLVYPERYNKRPEVNYIDD